MPKQTISILNIKAVKKGNKINYLVSTNEKEDNEYNFDEDTLVKYSIMKGKEFEKADFNKILKEIEISKLFNKCLNYLSYGSKSRKEIYQYLDKQNQDLKFSQTNFHEIVKKLEDLNYIDDLALSYSYVNNYKMSKGRGYISSHLTEKGIKEDIIETALEKYTKEEEIQTCLNIAIKNVNKNTKYPILKQKNLLTSKLIRDGFSSDIIKSVIQKLTFIDESAHTLIKDIDKQIKKYEKKDKSDYEKHQLILASLMNKGYNYKDIQEVLKNKIK